MASRDVCSKILLLVTSGICLEELVKCQTSTSTAIAENHVVFITAAE
jgi:hypothetical protein